MPKVLTLSYENQAAVGALAALQFNREEPDVLISCAARRSDGVALLSERIEVRTIDESGNTIDAALLQPDGRGGLQLGLHLMRVGFEERFRVAVVCPNRYPYSLSGVITALHGMDTRASELMQEALVGKTGIVVDCTVRTQIPPLNEQVWSPVSQECEKQIVPLYNRKTTKANYLPAMYQLDPLHKNCDVPMIR